MEEFLGKEYKMVSEENFEQYLVHIGLNYIKRKIAVNTRPIQCLTRNADGKYKFTVHSSMFTWDMIFEPGVVFYTEKPDGGQIESLITFEGNVMTHKQWDKKGLTSVHVLEFTRDEVVTVRCCI
ncbi:unnamed protein product [Diatraea saccharalis]|uniref:Uncharacterized protein n=1 Tax=Diatraea saccharalis TaxID=40085 RepID=A0A9N9WG76_9NEOP|nr:unnamed protein product [Diatraea saccharalis]